MLHKIGIDLGGTKTEIIVLDESLNILQRKRVPTPQDDYEKILQNIVTLVNDVSQNLSDFSLGVFPEIAPLIMPTVPDIAVVIPVAGEANAVLKLLAIFSIPPIALQ